MVFRLWVYTGGGAENSGVENEAQVTGVER